MTDKKLTLVSIYTNGRRVSAFVDIAATDSGKVKLNMSAMTDILADSGISLDRGQIFSVGAA